MYSDMCIQFQMELRIDFVLYSPINSKQALLIYIKIFNRTTTLGMIP